MNLNLNNNDFILGVLAGADPDLRVDWVAVGNMDHAGGFVGYEWRLITHAELDVHRLVLVNSEGGVEWKGDLSGITKREITEGLISPFRKGDKGELQDLACLLTSEGASVNKRWVSKPLLVRAVSEGCEGLQEPFDGQQWAKAVGFK